MKIWVKVLITLFGFSSFKVPPHKNLVEIFKIRNFTYAIYKEEKYIHDENIHAVFFVVYKSGKYHSCSAFMDAKRNDTLLINGIYSYNDKRLKFKEIYRNGYSISDSMTKTFYPNKKGDLNLIESIGYKNGVSSKTKY